MERAYWTGIVPSALLLTLSFTPLVIVPPPPPNFLLHPTSFSSSLLPRPIRERRKLLEQNITEVKNHIMLSEQKFVRVRKGEEERKGRGEEERRRKREEVGEERRGRGKEGRREEGERGGSVY